MKIKEVTFTREELEDYKILLKAYRTVFSCDDAIKCRGINCNRCPLNGLSNEEALKYIEEHLEEE